MVYTGLSRVFLGTVKPSCSWLSWLGMVSMRLSAILRVVVQIVSLGALVFR